MKAWIIKELATADLGDNRLQKRMELILERLTESPMESIKSAFKGWAEVIGAYRFLNNKKTDVEGILKPHQDATLERVKEFKRVLFVQDTTELDYTPKKSMEGTGPLSFLNRQGFLAHNQLVITPERLPLGLWGTQIYARDEAEHGKSEKRKQKPIEEKESFRWLQGYQDACEL
ncbi:MAG: transposase [Deltaproteobacteria bacterium]|nr:transposase [Deltaproteobacteria bacterium]MBW2218191.1 transposase [Deltaproteobacteria bacterium]